MLCAGDPRGSHYNRRVLLRRIPRPRRVARLAAPAAGLAVATGLALALAGCGGSSPTYTAFVRKPPPDVGATAPALPDATAAGAPFRFAAPAKGVLLVFFGYTMCPDVCPTTLSDLGVAVRGLTPEEQARIRVAFVTVDPRRDTAPVSARYIRSFFRKGHALRTGDAAQLAAAAKAFGAAYRVTRAKNGEVDVIHSAFTYAVDDQGKLRLQWRFGTAKKAFADDLHTLLRQVG